MGGEVKDYGVVTTPMLHYFVACINTGGAYSEPTEDGYFKKIITAFKKLRGDVSFISSVFCVYEYYHTLHYFGACSVNINNTLCMFMYY
jgi:hypothetical protein